MKNFFLKKIKPKALIYRHLLIVLILAAAAAIPLVRSYGGLYVGGDVFIPFLPENSYKLAHEWLDRNNGEYFTNSYRVWLLILNGLKSSHLSIYQVGFIVQFLIFFLSGLGIYRIYGLIRGKNSLFGLIPAVFFIYSPYLLDHVFYELGTIGIVWATYYFIKFIKYKTLTFLDVIAITLGLALVNDLPNPKYHFLLFVMFVAMIAFAFLLRLFRLQDLKKMIRPIIVLLLLSSYLLLPLIYFAFSFIRYGQVVINVKKAYISTGVTLDYGEAIISKMMHLFHNPILSTEVFYYLMPIVILGIFPFVIAKAYEDKKTKRLYYLIYFLAIFFIFFSKSSNPPFGFFYERMLAWQLLAFMRTSAGIVVYAAIFYALIYGLVFEYLWRLVKTEYSKLLLTVIFISLIIVWGFPFWSGSYYLSRSPPNTIGYTKYGIIVPNDYFRASSFLQPFKLDTKIEILPQAIGYQTNSWGYHNGFIFYPFLFGQSTISFKTDSNEERARSHVNARYIVYDKTTFVNNELSSESVPQASKVFQSNILDIYRLPLQTYIPHLYIPQKTEVSSRISNSFLKSPPGSIGLFSLINQPDYLLKLPKSIPDRPTIEYKKITPTKYRLIIHNAKGVFPLIFLENFHRDWKLYGNNMTKQEKNKGTLLVDLNSHYKILDGNESEQASFDELKDYIKQGEITSLGDGREKQYITFSYLNSIRTVKSTQASRIDFISKNFSGTIQNDNLPTDYPLETLLKKEIKAPHLLVNGYFNSWLIDSATICDKEIICNRNRDGGYDMEFIIEFWPQQISNLGFSITLLTLLGYTALHMFVYIRKKLL